MTLGDAVDFRGSASDADGTVASHAWQFGDGNGASVEDPGLYTYGAAGTYTVTYQVTDDDGATSSADAVTVTVEEPPNQRPTARITRPSRDTTVTLGDAVDFRGSASDADGTVASHAWDFDDGNGASVEDPRLYTYAAEGTYRVTYRVTDDDGATSSADAVTVTVTQGASAISVSPEFAVLRVSGMLSLTVTVLDALGNVIPSPTFQVTSRDPAVVTVSGADLTGQARGVTDVVVTSGSVADSARIAVVAGAGFAAMFSTSRDNAEITAASGSTLVLDLWMIRPPGGSGDLGSLSGTLRWDASRLTYVSSASAEASFTWVPNETNASGGTLVFGTFSPSGSANTFVLARVTFNVGGAAGGPVTLNLDISAAGTSTGTNITALIEAVGTSVNIQ